MARDSILQASGSDVRPVMGAQRHSLDVDRAIGALAARQHGVVTRAQLGALGLSRRAIGHRLECGRLHPVHRGVLAVGHRELSQDGRWMAAVLAIGPSSVLSHRAAGALWGLGPAAGGRIDVTVAMQRRPRAGLSVHRVPLALDEVTRRRTIPVTTAQRTLLDLAGVLGPRALQRAVNEAAVLRLPDAPSLGELVARHPRAPGVGALRALFGSLRAGITRSELEDAFLALVDRAELPRPQVNLVLEHAHGRGEADCVWPHAGVVVELDGYKSHGTRLAFERDRARDGGGVAGGPGHVAAGLRAAGRRGGRVGRPPRPEE